MNMNDGKSHLYCAALSIFALILNACSMHPMQQVKSLNEVASDKIIVVGRVEFHPRLEEGEQSLKSARGKSFKNLFSLYCSDEPRDLQPSIVSGYEGAYGVLLEDDFYLETDSGKPFYVLGGIIQTVFDPPYSIEAKTFKSLLKTELRSNDKAVYIGTIQYYRDEFFNLNKVVIIDDYGRATIEFKKRFKTNITLRKALLSSAE
jgi:hypothetical protein